MNPSNANYSIELLNNNEASDSCEDGEERIGSSTNFCMRRLTALSSDFEDTGLLEMQRIIDKSFLPVDPKEVIKFQIIRERSLKGESHPTYKAFIEFHDGQCRGVFKATLETKWKPSTYRIEAILPDTVVPRGELNTIKIATVKSNYLGTRFAVESSDYELAAVLYNKNPFGLRGPRKMTVIVPPVDACKNTRGLSKCSSKGSTFFSMYRKNNRNDIIVLHNKTPRWSEEDQMFYLNFQGRVTVASVKNFQIIHRGEVDYVLMQFGKVGPNAFSLDVRYPMSCVQAFGIVLSSLDTKVACE